jgi:hypothetical protein
MKIFIFSAAIAVGLQSCRRLYFSLVIRSIAVMGNNSEWMGSFGFVRGSELPHAMTNNQ